MIPTYNQNTNINPYNLERHIFFRGESIVKSLVKQANRVCRDMISEDYIRTVFKSFDYGFSYKDSDGSTIGFVIWEDIHENTKMSQNKFKSIKITLICTLPNNYHLGEYILFELDNHCRQRKINKIRLEAANPELVKYYEENGYKLTNDPGYYFMEKYTDPIYLRHRNDIKRNTKRTQNKINGKTRKSNRKIFTYRVNNSE